MRHFLSDTAFLKRLETQSVYSVNNDELYELDQESLEFLMHCSTETGGVCDNREFISYCLEEGILKKTFTACKRPPLEPSPVPSLRYLELQITEKCNLRCRHCYIGETSSSELPPDLIRDILREFQNMQGLRVLITGGEPLVHADFPAINEMLPDFSLRKVLFTNGLLLTEGLLKGLNVQEIQVSIDGLEEAHDSLRGRGMYQGAVASVKHALDAGFEVSVATMVHRKNLDDFEEMELLLKGLGVREWTVDVPCLAGRLKENPDLQIAPEEAGRPLTFGYSGGMHGGAAGYGCGRHLMAVTGRGAAAKCTFYADRPVGDISEGLRECWLRIQPVLLSGLSCDCSKIEVCRGGCRYRAEILGDPLGKDLFRCSLHDIMI